jgi:hypothetical protein
MKLLPHAIAIGNIHSGTITGKLNGVIPAHTPTGWQRVGVDLRADVLGVLALEKLRDAAGELDHLDAALHRAHRVGERLAVLVGDDFSKGLLICLQKLEKFLKNSCTPERRRVAPLRKCGRRCIHGRIDRLGVRKSDPLRHLAGGGVEHLAGSAGVRGGLAVDPERNGVEFQICWLVHALSM